MAWGGGSGEERIKVLERQLMMEMGNMTWLPFMSLLL